MHYFCQNIAFLKNYYLYNLVFDFNIRNRLDLTISILEIKSTFRFQLLKLIRPNLGRVLDSNLVTRLDTINLCLINIKYFRFL